MEGEEVEDAAVGEFAVAADGFEVCVGHRVGFFGGGVGGGAGVGVGIGAGWSAFGYCYGGHGGCFGVDCCL